MQPCHANVHTTKQITYTISNVILTNYLRRRQTVYDLLTMRDIVALLDETSSIRQ
jgi:uncharacterized protein YjiS (DUF1127 family)